MQRAALLLTLETTLARARRRLARQGLRAMGCIGRERRDDPAALVAIVEMREQLLSRLGGEPSLGEIDDLALGGTVLLRHARASRPPSAVRQTGEAEAIRRWCRQGGSNV